MNRDIRAEIFARLRDQNPNPTTELEWATPFELLIAVLLSQATDVSVSQATRKLYAKANTPEAILSSVSRPSKIASKPSASTTRKQRTL